ncbi:MAG: homoserine dehydrogenase, partial [Acidimicrobiales bacterium]
GHVGSALVQLLTEQGDAITERAGLRIELAKVAVRDLAKARSVDVAPGVLTGDALAVVRDPGIEVVVEVIGGVDPAGKLILDALSAGKPVVTANKELVATHGAELFDAARDAGVDLLFEAAVGGGIPVIRPLRESLAGERISRVMGIVNGTTNYILTRMGEAGTAYSEALAEAQRLGYAESDPSADVEGYDAAAKAAILASVAFGARVVAADVHREGITAVTASDIAFAARRGYVIKLLAVAEQAGGAVAVRVHPALVPVTHPLAAVRDAFNAVFIEGEAVGELMLYGRGAGGRPTASAVLGDLIDAAHNLRSGGAGRTAALAPVAIRPVDDLMSQYYLSFEVEDRAGVAHAVFGVTAEHRVSIESMTQEGLGDEARLVLITHTTRERDMQAVVEGLRQLDAVHRIGSLLRVVGAE